MTLVTALDGNWTRSETNEQLEIVEGQEFSITPKGASAPSVWGSMAGTGGEVIFQNDAGVGDCAGIDGAYAFGLAGDKLYFTRNRDECDERADLLSVPWTRAG